MNCVDAERLRRALALKKVDEVWFRGAYPDGADYTAESWSRMLDGADWPDSEIERIAGLLGVPADWIRTTEPALPEASSPTDLYRYFDALGRLLYVGISLSAVQRASQHRSRSGWWSMVETMTVERFPTRAAALSAEAVAIRNERPIHNVAGAVA